MYASMQEFTIKRDRSAIMNPLRLLKTSLTLRSNKYKIQNIGDNSLLGHGGSTFGARDREILQ